LAIIHGKTTHHVDFAVVRTTLNNMQKLHKGHYKLNWKGAVNVLTAY
jgi:hypothetical protein